MKRLLANRALFDDYGDRLREIYAATRCSLEPQIVPDGDTARLPESALQEIAVACFTGNFDTDPAFTRRFLGSALRAPNLRWMHLPNAGVDHPVFARLLQQGVRLSTSSGATAEPIAQTA